jgi:hypothetical protein
VIDANLIKYTNDGGKNTIEKIVEGWSHRDEQPVANGIVAIGGTQQNFQSDMEKFWRLEARALWRRRSPDLPRIFSQKFSTAFF